jgi:hypothetical protein
MKTSKAKRYEIALRRIATLISCEGSVSDIAVEWANNALATSGKKAAPDETIIESLRQLNALLKPESQGWTVVRNVRGGSYYYMIHDTYQPSAGIYVYSCKGTTLGFWRRELKTVIENAG